MMTSNNDLSAQLALYGMDERSYKTMEMYLQDSCEGIAIVVDELDAQIDLIDADYIRAREVLEERQSKTPVRPIILLSLEEVFIDGTIYLKKPVQKAELIAALNQANEILYGTLAEKVFDIAEESPEPEIESEPEPEQITESAGEKNQQENQAIENEKSPSQKNNRTAMDLTEAGFTAYFGCVEDIDFSDPEQVLLASYSSKSFFVGYVKTAIKVSVNKSQILQLNSGWKPLVIFPHSNEIWLDADNKQLRAYAGLAINKKSKQGMSLSPIDQKTFNFSEKMEKFNDIDAFLWKLAIWTSRGRYIDSIDISKPVYLRQWPNFTRLVMTPHAMRIAALLINGPRTAMNIADTLNISPQYVFVFISAAKTTGLVGQAKRNADVLIEPPEIKLTMSTSILSKLLGRLHSRSY